MFKFYKYEKSYNCWKYIMEFPNGEFLECGDDDDFDKQKIVVVDWENDRAYLVQISEEEFASKSLLRICALNVIMNSFNNKS